MKKNLATIFTISLLLFKSSNAFAIGSAGVAGMSALGMVYSYVLYDAAKEQEAKCNKNIKKLDALISTFKDSYADFCPNGRNKLEEPKCYCYLVDGKPNQDHSRSQTCLDLWAKDAYKLKALAGNYNGTSKFGNAVGCVTTTGQFDENCKCKKFVDAKGNNACMKTTSITIPSGFGSGFGEGAGLRELVQFSNNSANGNPRFDLVNGNQLNNMAIKSKKLQEQVITQTGPSLSPNTLALTKMNDKNVNQYAKAILGEKNFNNAMARGTTSALDLASTRSVDPKTEELLKAAEKKSGIDMVGSGKGLGNKKADGKELNFNFANDQSGAAAPVAQDFPEAQKNYNYKNSDISKNSDSSIFEIISNRYIQSGLKRLFDN